MTAAAAPVGGLSRRRVNAALLDAMKLGPFAERREGLAIGARHPGLAAQRDDLLEQRRAPRGVQMGGDLVEQQDRRRAVAALRDELGVGQDEADQQRLLLAGRAQPAPASALGPWPTSRSERCGPSSVRPAARSRSRPGAQRCDVVVLDLDGRPRRRVRFERALERQLGPRETASPDRARRAGASIAASSSATASARAAAMATPVSAMMQLEALEARGVAHAVGQQAVALLHGALELAERACDSRDRSTAISRSRKRRRSDAGPGEQAVHGRRQPDHLDVVGERAGARLRLAVDAHDAAARGRLRRPAGESPVPMSTAPCGV